MSLQLVVYVSQCNQTDDQIPEIMHLFNNKSTCMVVCDVIQSDKHKTFRFNGMIQK